MQPTGPTATTPQSDLLKNMQPQPQQIFIPSSGSNGTGNIRPTQQTTTMYRGPPSSAAPRGGTRHVSMQPMFQQPMHQSVVVPSYPTFGTRQPAYQSPQYQYSQTIQQFYPSYQFYPPMQQPQTHQRGPVGINPGVGVNVGNTLSVQPSPNGPPGVSQAQMSLSSGPILSVPPCSSTVLGVASAGSGQQQVGVGMPSLVGVTVPTATQPPQTNYRRRKHALEIIDPDTKRNIFEDLESTSNTQEENNQEQIKTMPAISTELQMVATHQQPDLALMAPSGVNASVVLPGDNRTAVIYNMDLLQMQQQRDVAGGQTPVVSARSDAPSIEIRTTPQKPRIKRIIPITPPKDEPSKSDSLARTSESLNKQQTKKTDETSVNVQQLPLVTHVPPQEIQLELEQHSSIQTNIQLETNQHSDIAAPITPPETNIQITQDSNFSNITSQQLTADSKSTTPPISYSSSSSCSTDSQQQTDSNSNCCEVAKSAKSSIVCSDSNSNPALVETRSDPKTSKALEDIQNSLKNMKLHEKETNTITTTTAAESTEAPSVVYIENAATVFNGSTSNNHKNADIETSDKNANTSVAVALNNNNNDKYEIDEAVHTLKTEQTSYVLEPSVLTTRDETDRSASVESEIEIVSSSDIDSDKSAHDSEALPNASSSNSSTTLTPETSAAQISGATAITGAPLIAYIDGQWSPLNPTGKKQYNREQLLLLREAQASRIQPEVKNVSILPQPNLMPSFARGNNNNKRVQSLIGSIGGNRGGGGGGDGNNYISKQSSMTGVNARGGNKQGGMIRVNLSLNQDVKLSETDNAWRPRVLVGGKDGEIDPAVQAQREKEELIRSVRGILNKLTPEKFDALVEEIIKLKIDTSDKMENVMVLVFEKAIDEPNFSVSYARLCHRLITEVARDERMESNTKSNLALFRNALLDKTEREFTENVSKRAAKEAKLQPILDKIHSCTDPAEKVDLQAQLEEEERKIRRRSGGTVRFIGELFKISMLTGKIINHCIDVLIEPKTEDSLECLCKLLTTVGAKFEQTIISKENPNCYSLDRIMARMQAIASKTDNSNVSSRVRFMLQDVIDLRKNKWQSSRNEAPKTMDQIEKETKNEQLSSQYLNYGGMMPGSGNSGSGSGGGNQNSGKRDDRGGNRYNDSRSGGGGYSGSHSQRGDSGSLRRQQQGGGGNSNFGGNNDDNTWQVQTGKGSRSLAVDTNKLEGLLNQNLDMGSKKMGGVSQFIWSTQRQSAPTTTPSNSFAVLSTLVDSKNSDRDRDRGNPRNKGSYNKGSMERDRYNNDRGIHSRTGSSQGSRENSSSRVNRGGRSMTNATTSMQKSASHKNYTQPMAMGGISGKSSGISSMSSASANALHPHRGEQAHHQVSQQQQLRVGGDSTNTLSFPSAPPQAEFEELTTDEQKLMKSVLSELIDIVACTKSITSAIVPCINRIKEKQRCGFLYYILTDYLHLANVGQLYRRFIANVVIYMLKNKFISVVHFNLAYEQFCQIASDIIYDVPDLWLYIFEFAAPLIQKQMLTLKDLWIKGLQEDESPKLGQKFLRALLVSCTREIGPSFTKSIWEKFNIKWTDFMPENEVKNFIQSNKFEYIENSSATPEIVVKDSRDKHIAKVVERVEILLLEGSDQNAIMDYINGNIVDVDKQFIFSLTTVVSNFAINSIKPDISSKESSYKLDTEVFQKVSIPVLQRYIDSKEERELECLYAMQLLVHSKEHPRALLSDLFGELYDNDVILSKSFIKWRDSKDQSAGKGVAVKGLGQFFNNIVSEENSDENN